VAFKDILLPVRSYPDPTPSAAIEFAVDSRVRGIASSRH
jgi:hypothetical protein